MADAGTANGDNLGETPPEKKTAKEPRNVICFDDVEHTENGTKYIGVFCHDPTKTGGARLFRMRAKYLKR